LTIADWQYKASFSADKEIPFAALLLDLMNI